MTTKKTITKAVNTKAFETASVEINAPAIYQVRPSGQQFVIYLNGSICNKHGKKAETVGDAFYYRNEKLAFEALVFFQGCK
jgi:hypothetical protein